MKVIDNLFASKYSQCKSYFDLKDLLPLPSYFEYFISGFRSSIIFGTVAFPNSEYYQIHCSASKYKSRKKQIEYLEKVFKDKTIRVFKKVTDGLVEIAQIIPFDTYFAKTKVANITDVEIIDIVFDIMKEHNYDGIFNSQFDGEEGIEYENLFPINDEIIQKLKYLYMDVINEILIIEFIYRIMCVKISFEEYKNLKSEYDFSKYHFLNGIYDIIEFSKQLENYEGKLIYLKCMLNNLPKESTSEIKILQNEIDNIENIMKYKTKAPAKPRIKKLSQIKTKPPKQRKLKKFQFKTTYESIERIFQMLISAGFINPQNSVNIGSILNDTFQKYNKNTCSYKDIDNTDYNASNSTNRKKNEVVDNMNSVPIDIKNTDYTKFVSLLEIIKKIIPEN